MPMTTKHTPGPWTARGRIFGRLRVQALNGRFVACILELIGTDDERNREAEDANARLIAAAPDMRAELDPDSLDFVADLLARHYEHRNVVANLREKARRERALLACIDGEDNS